MKDLIKALEIFSKYTDTKYPTHCEHDILMICDLEKGLTLEDKTEVEKFGFFWSNEYDGWCSFQFGSC